MSLIRTLGLMFVLASLAGCASYQPDPHEDWKGITNVLKETYK